MAELTSDFLHSVPAIWGGSGRLEGCVNRCSVQHHTRCSENIASSSQEEDFGIAEAVQLDMISSILASAGDNRPSMHRQSSRPMSQLDHISPGVLLFLTSLTVLTTGLAVVQYLSPESSFSTGAVKRITELEDTAPFLAQMRTSEGKTFTRGNIAKAPWLYGIGHILPA